MNPLSIYYLAMDPFLPYPRMEMDQETEEILEQGAIPLVSPPTPIPTPATPKLENPYTVKCSLLKFCKDERLRKQLNDAALNIYQLVVEAQNLMNLVLRVRFNAAYEKGEVPVQEAVNEKYVQQYFYAITDQGNKTFP